jgi:YD repeat-containing protein
MLKNPTLLAVFIAIFIFQACKKNNDTPANSTSYPKTYTEDVRITGYNSLTTYNLSHDGNGRLTSMTAIPEPAIVKFIYNYTSANTLTMDLYNSNVLSIREFLWLNTFSMLDSTYQYNDTNDSSTEKYIYNSDKQLVQVKNYNYYFSGAVLNNTTDYTYDNSGNPVLESNSQGTSTSYTYYTDLPNTFSLGKEFFPAPKYFIKTASSSSGGTPVTATHYYSFDGSNRLVKDSAVTTGVDAIVIKSYTY